MSVTPFRPSSDAGTGVAALLRVARLACDACGGESELIKFTSQDWVRVWDCVQSWV